MPSGSSNTCPKPAFTRAVQIGKLLKPFGNGDKRKVEDDVDEDEIKELVKEFSGHVKELVGIFK